MTSFEAADADERDRATAFVGRVAQLDPAALIKAVGGKRVPAEQVDLYAKAGFGVVASVTIAGRIDPDPLTVYATNLVAALAVSTHPRVDAGTEASAQWHTQLPPATGWTRIGELSAATVVATVRGARVVADAAVVMDRADEWRARTKATVPPAILDRPLARVPSGDVLVPVSMRMLFAVSGLGWVGEVGGEVGGEESGDGGGDSIGVEVTATWLRLSTVYGWAARRRMADLALPASADDTLRAQS